MSADEKKKAADIGEFLDVRNLTVQYTSMGSVIHAVNGISFRLNKGETLALVGETGAGKTSIAKEILRILPDVSAKSGGEVYFQGTDMMKLKEKEMQKIRGHKISMIFQDPMTALNPTMRIGRQISEVVSAHRNISKEEAEIEGKRMLELVGIPAERYNEFPHQFSGGQRQRIGIARSLVVKPSIIIADEPVSALDVSIQAQVINLLMDIKKEMDLTILFIAHNLAVVKYFSDRIGVMHFGTMVELADADELYAHPVHPYTKSLLSAIPQPDPDREKDKQRIYYDPSMHDYSKEQPSFQEIRPGHFVYASDSEMEKYRKEL